MLRSIFVLICLFMTTHLSAFSLRERLQDANQGDYIVSAIDNTYTVILIKEKTPKTMVIEEITVPSARLKSNQTNWRGWKTWVKEGAPFHTAWVQYSIERDTSKLTNYYSHSKQSWCQLNEAQCFLSKLLNLDMKLIPDNDRKRIGARGPKSANEHRPIWTPKIVFEGEVIPNVPFDAWRTRWPKDNSELSDKLIIAYLPQDKENYPSYFPYWLEVHGLLGKAKIRIIDSGKQLISPKISPKIIGENEPS